MHLGRSLGDSGHKLCMIIQTFLVCLVVTKCFVTQKPYGVKLITHLQCREQFLCDLVLAAEDMAIKRGDTGPSQLSSLQIKTRNTGQSVVHSLIRKPQRSYECLLTAVSPVCWTVHFYMLETIPQKNEPQVVDCIMEKKRWLKLCL
jgi:hypothetical protein